jgi:flagellar hook assembly protein FlgD
LGTKSAGYQAVKWNGRNEQGLKLTSGICFCRIEMKTKNDGQKTICDNKENDFNEMRKVK